MTNTKGFLEQFCFCLECYFHHLCIFVSRMTSGALRKFLCYGNPVVTIFSGSYCSRLHFHQTAGCKVAWQAESGFKPSKVAVVTKTTRYEFEQQRYLYAGLSEEDLKQLVRKMSLWCTIYLFT